MRMVWPSAIPLPDSPNEERLRSVFAAATPPTVGLEEELMLLDPHTFDLVPRAAEVLDRHVADPRFALELPASQMEIVIGPAATVPTRSRRSRAAAPTWRPPPPASSASRRPACIPSPPWRVSSTAARATTSPWPSTA